MLLEKKKAYKKGKIEKHRYMEEMFETHRFLFEYPLLIKDSHVTRIDITQRQVVFTLNNQGRDVLICCDPRDAYSIPMTVMDLSAYETEENEMMLRLINPRDVVFDVGANIGWYTINILLEHREATVFSFEPIESSFQYLKKNLALNGLPVKNIFNFGFSDQNKTERFYFDIECATASSMADLREDEQTTIVDCEVKKLDDFVESLTSFDRLDFVKCDVEGAEFFVYKGAMDTINRYKPIIFSEMLRKWSRKFNYHPNDIIDFFALTGYECFTIDRARLKPVAQVTEETIETNYLFLHRDKHKMILKRINQQL